VAVRRVVFGSLRAGRYGFVEAAYRLCYAVRAGHEERGKREGCLCKFPTVTPATARLGSGREGFRLGVC